MLFFSNRTTKRIGEELSRILNADLFEIEPVQKYTSEDLDWTNKQSRSIIEMEDENSRPEVKNKLENINDYKNVIIGFPVWLYKETPTIRTFLKENDLSNKRIIPFATNAGWLGKTFIEIKKMCPNSKVENEKNIVFESYSDELVTSLNEIEEWIKTI